MSTTPAVMSTTPALYLCKLLVMLLTATATSQYLRREDLIAQEDVARPGPHSRTVELHMRYRMIL